MSCFPRAVAARLAIAGTLVLAACGDDPSGPSGREQVSIEVSGTVTWIDGTPAAGSQLNTVAHYCTDALFEAFECSLVVIPQGVVDSAGHYSIRYFDYCLPGERSGLQLEVVDPVGITNRWPVRVEHAPAGSRGALLECQSGERVIDFVIEHTPVWHRCPDHHPNIEDAINAPAVDVNGDGIVCRDGFEEYVDNDQ